MRALVLQGLIKNEVCAWSLHQISWTPLPTFFYFQSLPMWHLGHLSNKLISHLVFSKNFYLVLVLSRHFLVLHAIVIKCHKLTYFYYYTVVSHTSLELYIFFYRCLELKMDSSIMFSLWATLHVIFGFTPLLTNLMFLTPFFDSKKSWKSFLTSLHRTIQRQWGEFLAYYFLARLGISHLTTPPYVGA